MSANQLIQLRTHDNTMMDAYSYCPRYYAISHVLNQRSNKESPPLTFGKLGHSMLDVYYRTLMDHNRQADVALAAAMLHLLESNYQDPEDNFRTLGYAKQMLLGYANKYGHDPEFEQILYPETAFDLPDVIKSYNTLYGWGGIIDLWVRAIGSLWIVDHKTTTRFGNYFYDNFKRAPQMIGYLSAGTSLHGQMPAGVLINTLILHKGGSSFDRKYITFPDWLVDDWQNFQSVNYEEIKQRLALTKSPADIWNHNIWKANLYNCVGKYGRCAAYDVCHSRPENRQRVLDMEFHTHQWDWSDRDDD